jgi:hypothetical protein
MSNSTGTNPSASKKNKKKKFFGLDVDNRYTPIILVGIILSLWLSCWVLNLIFFNAQGAAGPWPTRGQFGDMFGAVNALFSGLAFTGIIFTILLQREELQEQRRELRLTRKEFKQQNITLRQQRFENTFFNLLATHNEIVKSMDVRRTDTHEIIAVGRDCFKKFFDNFEKRVKQAKEDQYKREKKKTILLNSDLDQAKQTVLTLTVVMGLYVKTHDKYENDLGQYHRHLYNIIKLWMNQLK